MKVAIVGLGQIGARYDRSINTSYSHRNSLLRHPKSFDKFYVDKDQIFLASISSSDNAISYKNIDQLPNELDLIILSVPTKLHLKCFLELIVKVKFKKLILEKPAGSNSEETKIIINYASEKKIKVYVNYMRNTLPETKAIRDYIFSNQIKNFYADISISGDLINNGSHFLALIYYLMDFSKIDISIDKKNNKSINYKIGESTINLKAISKLKYPFFNMKIFHSKGLIEYNESENLWKIFNLKSSSPKLLNSKQLRLNNTFDINLSFAQDYFLDYVINDLCPESLKIDLTTANSIHNLLA